MIKALCVFSALPKKTQTNAKNIEKLGEYAIAIGDNLQQIANTTDEELLRISKGLDLHHGIQNQNIETHKEN